MSSKRWTYKTDKTCLSRGFILDRLFVNYLWGTKHHGQICSWSLCFN